MASPVGPVFSTNWYPDAQCALLAKLAASTNELPGAVIEVGCYEGRSTVALANAVTPATVYAVDTWRGDVGTSADALGRWIDPATVDGDALFRTFLTNMAAGTFGNVQPWRLDWREFFREFDESVRFCHIDATHSYAEALGGISTVIPLLVRGGIVAGDDIDHSEVRRAVEELLPGYQRELNLWWWVKP